MDSMQEANGEDMESEDEETERNIKLKEGVDLDYLRRGDGSTFEIDPAQDFGCEFNMFFF